MIDHKLQSDLQLLVPKTEYSLHSCTIAMSAVNVTCSKSYWTHLTDAFSKGEVQLPIALDVTPSIIHVADNQQSGHHLQTSCTNTIKTLHSRNHMTQHPSRLFPILLLRVLDSFCVYVCSKRGVAGHYQKVLDERHHSCCQQSAMQLWRLTRLHNHSPNYTQPQSHNIATTNAAMAINQTAQPQSRSYTATTT